MPHFKQKHLQSKKSALNTTFNMLLLCLGMLSCMYFFFPPLFFQPQPLWPLLPNWCFYCFLLVVCSQGARDCVTMGNKDSETSSLGMNPICGSLTLATAHVVLVSSFVRLLRTQPIELPGEVPSNRWNDFWYTGSVHLRCVHISFWGDWWFGKEKTWSVPLIYPAILVHVSWTGFDLVF